MKKLFSLIMLTLQLTSMSTLAFDIQTAQVRRQPFGMISCWKFDERSGSICEDSVNGNHGTIYGATWVERLDSGIVRNALSFDGTDDHVEIPTSDSLVFGTDDFTIMAWIYPTAYNGRGGLNAIMTKHNADEGSWLFRIAIDPSDGAPKVNFETDYPILRYYGNSIVRLYKWHHVAITRQGDVFTFYLDEKEDGSFIDTKEFTTLEPVRMSDQGNVDDERFTGTIDDVAIYNRALSAEEIQRHYQNGLIGLDYLEAPDVAVIQVTPYKTMIGQWAVLPINITVENRGNFTENFNVTAHANTTTIEIQEIMLTNRSSATITFTWDTAGFAFGNYTIWAYAEPVPSEASLADNTFVDGWVKLVIASDVNADGTVNILDITVVATAYNTGPRDPKWNAAADLDKNEWIDILDITIVAKDYGKTV